MALPGQGCAHIICDLVRAVVPDEDLGDDGVERGRTQQRGNALDVREARPVQDDDRGVRRRNAVSTQVGGETDAVVCLCTWSLKTSSTTPRWSTGMHTS